MNKIKESMLETINKRSDRKADQIRQEIKEDMICKMDNFILL